MFKCVLSKNTDFFFNTVLFIGQYKALEIMTVSSPRLSQLHIQILCVCKNIKYPQEEQLLLHLYYHIVYNYNYIKIMIIL